MQSYFPTRPKKIMQKITLYSRPMCWWCMQAKHYLKKHGIAFEDINVGHDKTAYEEMVRLSGQTYVPTLVMNGRVLANFGVEELEQFLKDLGVVPAK
jgi:glutaredoxin 3